MVVGIMVHGSILRAFPPKLEAYAEGNTGEAYLMKCLVIDLSR